MTEQPPLFNPELSDQFKPRPNPVPGLGLPQVAGGLGVNQLLPEGSNIFGTSMAESMAPDVPVLIPDASIGATQTGAAPSSFGLNSTGGMGALPIAGTALGAYLLTRGLRDSLTGREDNSKEGLASRAQAAFSTVGLSELGRLFGGGKPKEQESRDRARDALKSMGIVDGPQGGQATLQTYGGDSLDIGIDGGGQGNYNVDFTNPLAPQAVALVNPLAAIVSAKTGTPKEQVAGWLTNGILQNNTEPGNLVKEAQFLYRKMGVGPQELLDGLGQLYAQGKISREEVDAFTNSIRSISANSQNLKGPV